MAIRNLQRVPNIKGDSDEDTALLLKMADQAREYIQAFRWCPPIDAMYFGDGVGGLVAAFLVVFHEKIQRTDDELWVVVGDLPSAYMVVEPDETPTQALAKYCSLMEDWVIAVRGSCPPDDVFPVPVPATQENATQLYRRISFIRKEIVAKRRVDRAPS
jgi:hypothetical protein